LRKFSPTEIYEATYFHERSPLRKGSVQDKELRRAWFIALWSLLEWLQEHTEESDYDEFCDGMNEIVKEVTEFVMANTNSDERFRRS